MPDGGDFAMGVEEAPWSWSVVGAPQKRGGGEPTNRHSFCTCTNSPLEQRPDMTDDRNLFWLKHFPVRR